MLSDTDCDLMIKSLRRHPGLSQSDFLDTITWLQRQRDQKARSILAYLEEQGRAVSHYEMRATDRGLRKTKVWSASPEERGLRF